MLNFLKIMPIFLISLLVTLPVFAAEPFDALSSIEIVATNNSKTINLSKSDNVADFNVNFTLTKPLTDIDIFLKSNIETLKSFSDISVTGLDAKPTTTTALAFTTYTKEDGSFDYNIIKLSVSGGLEAKSYTAKLRISSLPKEIGIKNLKVSIADVTFEGSTQNLDGELHLGIRNLKSELANLSNTITNQINPNFVLYNGKPTAQTDPESPYAPLEIADIKIVYYFSVKDDGVDVASKLRYDWNHANYHRMYTDKNNNASVYQSNTLQYFNPIIAFKKIGNGTDTNLYSLTLTFQKKNPSGEGPQYTIGGGGYLDFAFMVYANIQYSWDSVFPYPHQSYISDAEISSGKRITFSNLGAAFSADYKRVDLLYGDEPISETNAGGQFLTNTGSYTPTNEAINIIITIGGDTSLSTNTVQVFDKATTPIKLAFDSSISTIPNISEIRFKFTASDAAGKEVSLLVRNLTKFADSLGIKLLVDPANSQTFILENKDRSLHQTAILSAEQIKKFSESSEFLLFINGQSKFKVETTISVLNTISAAPPSTTVDTYQIVTHSVLSNDLSIVVKPYTYLN